jgi:hypothetical protein
VTFEKKKRFPGGFKNEILLFVELRMLSFTEKLSCGKFNTNSERMSASSPFHFDQTEIENGLVADVAFHRGSKMTMYG